MSSRILLAKCILLLLFFGASVAAKDLSIKAIAPDKRVIDYKIYEDSKALLIGNSKYNALHGWENLPSIPKELDTIKSALIRQGFLDKSIKVVHDANTSELREAFRSFLFEQVSRETRLFIYYAGHGVSPDEISGYLVPTDAPAESSPEFNASLLGMSEIVEWSKRSKAKHALFVFDSCFSGSVFLTRSSALRPNQLFLNEADKPVRQFLTSGSANEEVPAISDFAEKLVKGMDGAADLYADGIVTANELGYWIKAELTPLGKQTPQYGSMIDLAYRLGDTVFLTTNGASSIVPPLIADPNLMYGPSKSKGATRSALGRPSSEAPVGFQGVDVYYYQKIGDGATVSLALEKANIPFVKTRSSRPQEEVTNGIACGPDVPVEAIKAVALALISSGVTLNAITRFEDSSKKIRRLEVLTNPMRGGPGLRNWAAGGITVQQVELLKSCPT